MSYYFSKTLPTPIKAERLEAAKGILILLVIIGHASNFWTPEPFATFSIKFFHVACFLLLPFLYEIKAPTWQGLRVKFIRYYVPFIFFLCAYSLLYALFLQPDQDWLTIGKNFISAALFANAPMLDAASGLRALWYMPALIAMVFMMAGLIGSAKIPAFVVFILAFALHATAGYIPEDIKFMLPFGLVSIFYLFFLGICLRLMFEKISLNILERLSWLFAAGFVLLQLAAWTSKSLIKFPVMALPVFPSLEILIHDGIILCAFLFLVTTRLFERFRILHWLGRNSLLLYLSHLGFLGVAMLLANRFVPTLSETVTIPSVMVVMLIFLFCLMGGIAVCLFFEKIPFLKKTITPSGY